MQLQFIIHFLPVSSGFHFYTLAFRLLFRVSKHYPQCKTLAVRTRKCRLLQRYVCDVTLTRAAITDIKLSRMTCAGSHLLPRIRHSLPTEEVENVEKIKYCESIHTLRSLPDQGSDVCKVWFKLVQKCVFV